MEINAEELMACGYCLAIELVNWGEGSLQCCHSCGALSPCSEGQVVEIQNISGMVPAEAIVASTN